MTQTDPLPRAPTSGTARDEPVDLVPAALRSALARGRRATSAVDAGALAIVVLQLVPMAWLVVPGSLYTDDLRAQGYAAGRSWWPFVVQSNGTHVSVLARTFDWATVRWAPLEHWPAVAVTLGLRAALVAVLWWLVRDLFGPRPAALLPLALVAVTPALVPTTAWNRQALPNLFVVTVLLAATALHVRWLRSGRTGLLLGAAACVVLGLLMFEKAVTIGPWLVLVTLLLPEAAGARARLRLVLRAWPAVVLYLLLDAVFVVLYVLGPYESPSTGVAGVGDAFGALRRLVGDTLAVGLLGGPLRWTETTPYYGTSEPPGWLVGVCVAAWVLFVAGTVLQRRRAAARAWLLLVAYLAVAFPVVALGRLGEFGVGIGSAYRLWADVVVVAALAAALAAVPLRPGADPLAASAVPARRLPRAAVLAGGAVGSALVLAAASVSTVAFARPWHRNPTGSYLAGVRASTAAQGSLRLYPTSVPEDVMPTWVDPGYDVEQLVAPLGRPVSTHDGDGPVALLTGTGQVVPARWETRSAAGPGPNGFCGRSIRAGAARRIALDQPVGYHRDDLLRLGLLAGGSGSDLQVWVVLDDGRALPVRSRTPLHAGPGPHILLARVPALLGSASSDVLPRQVVVGVDVRATDPAVPLCVVAVEYGQAVPTGGAAR